MMEMAESGFSTDREHDSYLVQKQSAKIMLSYHLGSLWGYKINMYYSSYGAWVSCITRLVLTMRMSVNLVTLVPFIKMLYKPEGYK